MPSWATGTEWIIAAKYSPEVQEGRPLRLFRGDLCHPGWKQIRDESFTLLAKKFFRTFQFIGLPVDPGVLVIQVYQSNPCLLSLRQVPLLPFDLWVLEGPSKNNNQQ